MKNYLRAIWILATKLIRRFFRDRIALFLTFFFPLIFLFVFGGIFNDDGRPSFDVALINNSQTEFAKNFIKGAEEDELFAITRVDNFEEAKLKLGRGEFDAILELSPNFGKLNSRRHPSGTIISYYDRGDQQLAGSLNAVLQSVLDGINQQFVQIEAPLKLESRALETVNLSQFDYTFSGLLGFSILSLAIFGMANGFPSDKKTGVLRRLRATPLRASQLILATALQYLLIGVLSVAMMMVIGILVFDFQMRGDYLNFTLFGVLSILLMFGFGLAIGGWAKNENQAAPLSNLVAFPMMFLSGVFFPVFLMPEWLQKITTFIPLTPVVEGLRLIMTEGKTLLDLGPQLAVIAVWLILIYVLAIRLFRWE